MAQKDYYKILGVDKNATKEEIKKAYKQLAKKYHPDLNPNNPESEKKFKEVNEAVSVLADDQKKSHYDQFGTSDESFQGFDANAFKGSGFEDVFGDFDSVFERFFGGGGGRRRNSRGADLVQEIEVELEDIAEETTKTIHINKLDQCKSCKGTGGERETCDHCKGSGVFARTQQTPFGLFQTQATCRSCQGTGSRLRKACDECEGEGRVRVKKDIDVTIPAGMEDGTRLRVRGEGTAPEHGGTPGDLYLIIHLKEHKIFKRRGNDILLKVPISFTQAVLGDEIEVPILNGKAVLKIPPYTQDNTVFRMRGKGLHDYHGREGDQLVKATIKIPDKLSKKEHDLVKELASLEKEKPASIFNKFFG